MSRTRILTGDARAMAPATLGMVLGTGPRLHRLEQERVRGLPVYLLSLYGF